MWSVFGLETAEYPGGNLSICKKRMADVIPKSPSLSAMSTATVTILSSLQLDDVIAVNVKGSDLEVHSLAPAKGTVLGIGRR